MFSVHTEGYKEMLGICYKTKTPLFVYGGPGLGKSMIPRQIFKEVATKKGRQFAEWCEMTPDEKQDATANPGKWFIFNDFRLGQCDSSDLRGIPRLEAEYMEYSPMPWVGYFKQPEADGVIFFDELNLAPPIVAGQAYQIINDRIISDIKISKNVFIFGAGNRAVDKAQVFTMPFPLRDRFAEIELKLSDESWCDWAMENKVNPHLVAFVKWKPSTLYQPPKGTEDKGSTPRGFVRASKLLAEIKDLESPIAHTLVSSALGEATATEFTAYVTVASSIDFESMIRNPSKVQGLNSPDKKFAICGLLGEHIAKISKFDEAGKKRSAAMIEMVDNLPDEYAVVALNLIRTSIKNNATFKKVFTSYKHHKGLLVKAAKFAL